MKGKIYILFVLLFFTGYSFAQFTLRIKIAIPATHAGDPVFIAGNFNGWNPGDNNSIFSNENGTLFLNIKNLAAANYQFKCTRGNWQKVETTATGEGIANRSIQLSSDTTIDLAIAAWADDFAAIPITHTLSENVRIVDTAFFIPQLNRHRRVWIYLPKDYATAKKHYPVMYLQDAQNVFDAATSSFGSEWGVDECLDTLIAKGKPACIVVAIDHGGGSRMSEYNPYPFTLKDTASATSFPAEGEAYLHFLTETLKPFIDRRYRTLAGKETTIIAGASMGGLIAYYAAIKYPEVFGKAGVFSPAFWTAPEIKELTDAATTKLNGKFFFYIGEKEGATVNKDMNDIAEELGANTSVMIYKVIDEEGQHNEAAWRKWFAEFYNWVMADGYNNVIKMEQ